MRTGTLHVSPPIETTQGGVWSALTSPFPASVATTEAILAILFTEEGSIPQDATKPKLLGVLTVLVLMSNTSRHDLFSYNKTSEICFVCRMARISRK